MYIPDKQSTFESRFHQLGTDTGAFPSFITEGNSYLTSGLVSSQASGKWNKEAGLHSYRLSGKGLGVPYFVSGIAINLSTIVLDAASVTNVVVTSPTKATINIPNGSISSVNSTALPLGTTEHFTVSFAGLAGTSYAVSIRVTDDSGNDLGVPFFDGDFNSFPQTFDFVAPAPSVGNCVVAFSFADSQGQGPMTCTMTLS